MMENEMKMKDQEGKLLSDVILSSEKIVNGYGKLALAIREAIPAGEIEKIKQLRSMYFIYLKTHLSD
ncbi:hypothetical protein [Paenibacillus glucanolyticus]|uniref:hypothetical protein n=1 Tax=Paenibacillus glucanolyticus TaxID=59843 RepID=UPI0011808C43|nr:hypothetical protein [Paenibacillus glucanolyticus]